jgi:DNA-binding CsgD family transcriptional regulator
MIDNPGQAAFARRAWAEAYAALSAADERTPLELDDLELLATAAWLLGRDDDSERAWARAFRELVGRGEPTRAARCGFWLAFGLLIRGAAARGAGWLARARRQLDGAPDDCAERGYLDLPAAIAQIDAGDCASALEIAREAAALGERCGDLDLVIMARSIEGRALLRHDDLAAGTGLFDEVMATVLADEVSAVVAGNTYCVVIEGCEEVFDVRRAGEWTTALTRWCSAQPGLVLYRGQCLIHRARIERLHGAWPEAADMARQACEQLTRPPGHPAAGAAAYLLAELHRLRGDPGAADRAYRQASRLGRQPQPGLALLRLAGGGVAAADAAIRRALAETSDPAARPDMLSAAVEILLAAGDTAAARASADELTGFAARIDMPLINAMAAHASGAVLLAEGDARAALPMLRRACALWQDIEAVYEAARVRVLLGAACRALGDEDGAEIEFDAARWAFSRLGAGPDLARLDAPARAPAVPGGLTAREMEVLRLVAAGKSNRAIAANLVLSEKTVARHVSNILAKLGVPSRSAATAFAFEHGLV